MNPEGSKIQARYFRQACIHSVWVSFMEFRYAMILFVALYDKPCKHKPITDTYMRHSASMS